MIAILINTLSMGIEYHEQVGVRVANFLKLLVAWYRGLIYKWLHRNHSKFDFVIISESVCMLPLLKMWNLWIGNNLEIAQSWCHINIIDIWAAVNIQILYKRQEWLIFTQEMQDLDKQKCISLLRPWRCAEHFSTSKTIWRNVNVSVDFWRRTLSYQITIIKEASGFLLYSSFASASKSDDLAYVFFSRISLMWMCFLGELAVYFVHKQGWRFIAFLGRSPAYATALQCTCVFHLIFTILTLCQYY